VRVCVSMCGSPIEPVPTHGVTSHWREKKCARFLCNFVVTRVFCFIFHQKVQPEVSLNTQTPSVAEIINNGTSISV